MSKHPVREAGGDTFHVRVFERVAIGLPVRKGSLAARWLVNHDLLFERGGTETPYGVPTWAHVQWCEWCASKETRAA
jgi:hypothetical protein